MKKTFIMVVTAVVAVLFASAQAPQAFTYQAVVRDNAGEIMAGQAVTFRVSIHNGSPTGTVVYQETHPAITNSLGMVTLEIGKGSTTLGVFGLIDWESGTKYLEIELDPEGGTTYQSMGTSQLLSVPFALQAERAAFGTDDDWVVSGDNLYSAVPGNVGIGITNPTRLFHAYGTVNPRILIESPADQTPEINIKRGSVTHAQYVNSDNDLVFYRAGDRMTLTDGGNLGIGINPPATRLHVASSNSSWGMFRLENSNTGQNEASMAFREGSDVTGPNTWLMGVGVYGNLGHFVIGRDGQRLMIDPLGNVGIGYSGASDKLALFTNTKDGEASEAISHRLTIGNTSTNDVMRLVGPTGTYGYGARLNFGDGDYVYMEEDVDDRLTIFSYRTALMGSYVGIGTVNPSERLTVSGNVRIESVSTGLPVVELGEGLDYAEGFDVTDPDASIPGTVMCIDPGNAGRLKVSSRPYDKKVAGIVAGANELGSGVKLGSGQYDCNVALAGRVYCNVDATYGKVEPGDLLTTSATPGHAMVVRNPAKAHGAILGKAMEPLEKGKKGQILVLVTLQ